MATQFDLDTMEGICMDCYTSPEVQGFSGIIKRHSEDFVVTEIDGRDQLVSLTSRHIPPLPPPPQPHQIKLSKTRPLPSTIPPLKDLITHDQLMSLQQLVDECKTLSSAEAVGRVELGCYADKEARGMVHIAVRTAHPLLMTQTDKRDESVVCVTALPDPKYYRLREVLSEVDTEGLLLFVNTASWDDTHLLSAGYDREARTKIHLLLHELYGALLSTHTHTSQYKRRKLSKKATPITENPSQIAIKFRGRKRREVDPPQSKLITKFVLHKRNIETLAAIDLLSEVVECQPSQFSCAGIKDKKAVTTQHMSVRGVDASRLDSVNEHADTREQLAVGDYEYTDRETRTGEHSGNHFKIVVRDVRGGAENLDNVVTMAMKGVQERGFVNYFGPQRFGGGTSAARIALAMLQRQYKRAVELILTSQTSDHGEAAIARDYYKATGDVTGTLEKMPHYKTRERYILKALHRHGHSDYGCVCALNSIPYSWRKLYFQGFSSLLWNHMASIRVREYGLRPVEGDLVLREVQKGESSKEGVHVLSSGDIHSEQYGIDDVVLPLLGTGSVFPDNSVAARLTEVLTALGLTLASFRMTQLGIHATGAYRKVLARPKQLSWQWLRLTSALRTSSQVEAAVSCHGDSSLTDSTTDDKAIAQTAPNETVPATEKSVEVCFSLDKACYATVLLRELMKCDV